ncbi:MAG: NADH-quinone oxidoreductase subunit H [Myxococcota bacterium]|jgi:NADH-quinone oxidoreductase subunit H
MGELILFALIKIVVILFGYVMAFATVLTWLERKYSALLQDRIGPNRAEVGGMRLGGLFHMIADPIKVLFKEDFFPSDANPILYKLAPWMSVVPPMMLFAVIPFGPGDMFVISDASIGVLFLFAMGGLGVYGSVFGGWASNSKYSLLGGLRTTAQMISYEVAMGLNLVGIFMIYEAITLQGIIGEQGGTVLGFIPAWGIFLQPVSFFLFMASAMAENKRAPFDLPEAESELVAGYFTEYSSMKFALFSLGEFIEIVAIGCITTCLFLGGWQIPWVEPTGGFLLVTLQVLTFLAKVAFMVWVQMTIRWTLPRFRYDQIMKLGWVYILPLSLINILATGVVLYILA